MAGPVVDVMIVRPAKLKAFADGLKDMEKGAVDAAVTEMTEFAGQFLNYAKLNAPVKKGKFRNALEVRVFKTGPRLGEMKLTYRPGTDRPKKLMEWIIRGTGIYGPRRRPIVPKRKPFLAWKDYNGKWRYAKSVRGMKPRDFIGDAWEAATTSRELLKRRVGRLLVNRLIK